MGVVEIVIVAIHLGVFIWLWCSLMKLLYPENFAKKKERYPLKNLDFKEWHYIKEFRDAHSKALWKFEQANGGKRLTEKSFHFTIQKSGIVIQKAEEYKGDPSVLSLINVAIRDKGGEEIITALHTILADDEVAEEVLKEEKSVVTYIDFDWPRVERRKFEKPKESVINTYLDNLNQKIDALNEEIQKVIDNHEKMKQKQKELKVYSTLNQSWVFGEDEEKDTLD